MELNGVRGFMSKAFLFVAGLTNLGGFGGIWGQNKAKASTFSGSAR
jgi:hypothetical protein